MRRQGKCFSLWSPLKWNSYTRHILKGRFLFVYVYVSLHISTCPEPNGKSDNKRKTSLVNLPFHTLHTWWDFHEIGRWALNIFGHRQIPVWLCFLKVGLVEGLVGGICTYGVDKGKYFKTPGLFGDLALGCLCIIRSDLRSGKTSTNTIRFCLRKYFGFCWNLISFCFWLLRVILPQFCTNRISRYLVWR